MKLLIQSIIFSLAVHIIYFAGSLVHGWFITRYYVPDIENAHEKIVYLQNEVSFGYIISPIYLVFSFIVVALISAGFIQMLKKIRIAKRSV